MISFEFLRIFGEKSQKWKLEKYGQNWLLHRSVGNPRHSVGYPRRGEPEEQKWHPSGMPRRRFSTPLRRAMLRRCYCSRRAKF